jgi:uncharacterized protein YjdB
MKTRARAMLCLCLAAAILCALPVGALGAVKQQVVNLSTKLITIDLATSSTYQLTGSVYPAKASQKMVWRSGTTSIASISSTGLIKAKKTGNVTVGARPSSINKWTKATVKIIDSSRPKSILLNVASLKLTVGATSNLTATALPSTASQSVKWASNKSSVARVSSSGVVTAVSSGTALIRATSTRTSSVTKTIKVTVAKLPAPSKLILSPADTKVEKGDTLQLDADVSPSGSDPSVKWSSSNPSVATVSSSGVVSTKATGTVKITATSTANGSVSTIRTLSVVDTKTVTSVEIESDTTVLFTGSSMTLDAQVLPETAPQTVTWTSNNAPVATISASGTVSARATGSATITVKAGTKTDTLHVVVQKPTAVTEEPSQVTSVGGINANLSKIDDILRYATTQLDALYVSGSIDKDETNSRKTILLNAFKMARLPWMSSKTIPYYSGGGYFRSNVVYFGIPYTQKNRTYNVEKLLSAGAFKKEGSNNYYTASLPGVTYPGNDCSSFVSMSQWGLGTAYSALNSDAMKISAAYKTIASSGNKTGFLNMRPGDVLVKNGHALMFLYYANSAKSQVMVIQQGGFDTLSSVSCDLKSLSYYSSNSNYVARRKPSFD